MQYFDKNSNLNETYLEPGRLCLIWALNDKQTHITKFNAKCCTLINKDKWFDLVLFPAIMSILRVVRSNRCVPPFSLELSKKYHYFFMSKGFTIFDSSKSILKDYCLNLNFLNHINLLCLLTIACFKFI